MTRPLPASIAANPRLDRWIAVDPDTSKVTVRTGKVELGQGAVTAIAAIAAHELGLRLDQIEIVAGSTATTPDEGYTAGSYSIQHGGEAMRWASAKTRELFMAAAANALDSAVKDLMVDEGRFFGRGRNDSRTYWDLAPCVSLDISLADQPEPAMHGGTLPPEAITRLDLPEKLSGPGFIHDIDLPGLLFGRVLRPPHERATLVSLDKACIESLAGVRRLVVDGSFVGVVADRDEQAVAAVKRAEAIAVWLGASRLPNVSAPNEWINDTASLVSRVALTDDGAQDEPQHRATYTRPYIAHASIGPACAIARWRDGKLHLWTHSQGVFPLRNELARALAIPADDIVAEHRPGSGCYGHNGADDVALDAALLARGGDEPVMCQWSRKDELSWSPFGAAMRVGLGATCDAGGRIRSWHGEIWSHPHLARPSSDGPGVTLLAARHLAAPIAVAAPKFPPLPTGTGERNGVPIYDVGLRHVIHHGLPQGPVRSSALRSLGAHCNVFAIESFMDELAMAHGIDPLAFRLMHLGEPRARAVLEAAAARANWQADLPGGEGIGRGLGVARYKNLGGYCAIVATVEVDDKVRVRDVVAAVDCGAPVHRDGLINQVEGGIIQALSWTLKEAVRWDDGQLLMRSWDDYPILAWSEIPRVDIVLLEDPVYPSLGAGEVAAGPVAAAVGNAVAHALGVRVRDMPLTYERIENAINAA